MQFSRAKIRGGNLCGFFLDTFFAKNEISF